MIGWPANDTPVASPASVGMQAAPGADIRLVRRCLAGLPTGGLPVDKEPCGYSHACHSSSYQFLSVRSRGAVPPGIAVLRRSREGPPPHRRDAPAAPARG